MSRSSLIIFERHANLKYKYGNRTFWCRGFYVSTVGNNKEIIKSFESEEERDKYFDMLIQEKNSAVDLSRKVYNEYLDKLLEASNEKNEENPNKETHKVKVKRIKRK